MKKILAVILACVIVAAFTACSTNSSSQGGETSSSQSESESSASDRVKVEDEKLTNLIKNLNDTVQPGSARVRHLKQPLPQWDFIRWADGCELTDGDIEKVVTEALSSYDDTEKGTFFEAWSLVKSSYETIKAGGDDAAELLQSAGVEGEVTVNENADKAFSALDSAINTVVVSTEE